MNKITRMSSAPAPVQQSGPTAAPAGWWWDGSQWVCDPCNDGGQFGPPVFSGPVSQPPWYPGANGGVSFGSTPPPNPVRGHLWWNGVTFWLFDGAAWVAVGSAGGGGGTPPSGTPPVNPAPGQQWFNGSTLYVWDGNAWVPVSQTKTFIQAGAPSAPNPGDLWWDGSVMKIWDGSTWETVGPGALQGPVGTTTIVFAIQQPTSLALGSATWTIMPYIAAPMVDTMAGWDSVQHRYTPKKAGMYQFGARAIAGSTGGGIAIAKNDPGTFSGVSSDLVTAIASNSATGWMSCDGMAQMNGTTDYVRAWGWETSGAVPAAGSNPVFSAVLLP